jgi:PKD repeat protein
MFKKNLLRIGCLWLQKGAICTTILQLPAKNLQHTMNTNRTFLATLLHFLYISLFSQTPISGVVNHYTSVMQFDYCNGVMLVNDPMGFLPGDKVLVIQMQGASINTSNSGNFGDIENMGGAGFYEINEIKAISGNEITLRFELLHEYSVNGGLQLVSVPVYQDAVVTGLLTAAPWNGATGGVVVLQATGTLTLEAPIDVSGKGFRGGAVNVVHSPCTFLTNADKFHYNAAAWEGAPKGEGIAATVPGKELGRGAQANGGGGGNDHNAGGGGGANYFQGGIGGKQGSSSIFGCTGKHPGRGGKATPVNFDRLLLGGGGGAGHIDDDGAGSAGGNGGGIVILIADKLISNGQSILSNGIKPLFAHGDGAGGGGAGGTVLLDVKTVEGNLSVEITGGDGGDVANDASRCFGAGGGGAGGRLITTNFVVSHVDLKGGSPGINTEPSGECDGPSNGAMAGLDGLQQTNLPGFPFAGHSFEETSIVSQPQSEFGCENLNVAFSFFLTGNYLLYQWQENDGTGWVDLTAGNTYDNVNKPTLSINNPQPGMNGFQYRCHAYNACGSEEWSAPASLNIIAAPSPDFSFSSLGNGEYQFSNNSQSADSYLWDFGDGETSSESSPVHQYANFGDYTVTLTATNACGSVTLTKMIAVQTPPSAAFHFDSPGGCFPLTVQFFNESSVNSEGFEWHFEGGTPAVSYEANPVIVFEEGGIFDVILIAHNVAGADTLVKTDLIVVDNVPAVNFSAAVNDLTVTFANLSQQAAYGYYWDFGDGNTSVEVSPVHTYATGGFYTVTLTAENECGQATYTQSVATGAYPNAAFEAQFFGGCAPLTVAFTNLSTGANLTEYAWEFPGGFPATSNLEHPAITYETPGVYDVKLTVKNALGEHTIVKPQFVEVKQSPEALFDFTVTDQAVHFINQSTDGWTYLIWDFGDGTSSTMENPLHVYQQPGFYDVTLTLANSACGSAISRQIFLDFTAIKEAEPPLNMEVFPNPASDIIFAKIAAENNSPVAIKLWDNFGRALLTEPAKTGDYSFDISGFSAGIYWLEIRTESAVKSVKLVKL